MSDNENDKIVREDVNTDSFIRKIAEENGMSIELVKRIYNSFIDVIFEVVSQDKILHFYRLGHFGLYDHKGHSFNNHNIGDYKVFKFTPSRICRKRIREMYDKNHNGEV